MYRGSLTLDRRPKQADEVGMPQILGFSAGMSELLPPLGLSSRPQAVTVALGGFERTLISEGLVQLSPYPHSQLIDALDQQPTTVTIMCCSRDSHRHLPPQEWACSQEDSWSSLS